jgi:hypothetical protein
VVAVSFLVAAWLDSLVILNACESTSGAGFPSGKLKSRAGHELRCALYINHVRMARVHSQGSKTVDLIAKTINVSEAERSR